MIPRLISRFTVLLAFLAVVAGPGISYANIINVDTGADGIDVFHCTLREAIENHNAQGQPNKQCAAGSKSDTIYVPAVMDLGDPLPPIKNTLTILRNNSNSCGNMRQAAYMTITAGANVTLWGVGIQVNGSHKRSAIVNNGGTLTIKQFSTPVCRFSNEHTGNKPDRGGILLNYRGTVTISGDDLVFSHAYAGGAIYSNGGSVTINNSTGFRTNFIDDNAHYGGAIFLEGGATLNIASNNFRFIRNEAETVGGAIYNFGAKVTIQGGTSSPLSSALFNSNRADRGGAIYSNGGQLSISGVEISDNSAKNNGGAVAVENVSNPAATITQTYFHGNSADGHGGAVYVTDGSTLNVSASTFSNDRARANGGEGIYVNNRGSLNVINSTFLGERERDGVFVESGTGTVTFSTLVTSTVGTRSSLTLSNSILYDDVCSNVSDSGYNLQFRSTGCPTSILTQNPLLSSPLLANNGGPTPTIALLSGSPAINAIPPGNCIDQNNNQVTTDQRGYGRPAPGSTYCDEGAFEFDAVPLP